MQERLQRADREVGRLEAQHEADLAAARSAARESQAQMSEMQQLLRQAEQERDSMRTEIDKLMGEHAERHRIQEVGAIDVSVCSRVPPPYTYPLLASVPLDTHVSACCHGSQTCSSGWRFQYEAEVSSQEHWEFRLQEAEALAACQLEVQQVKLAEATAMLDRLQESTAAAAADQQRELQNLQQEHASLANAHSEAISECRDLKVLARGSL